MAELISGSDTNLSYGWETTRNTKSTIINKSFGVKPRVSTFEEDNKIEEIAGDGSKTAKKIVSMGYEASASVNFWLASPWLFTAALGMPVKSVAGNSLNNYTWDSNGVKSTVPQISIGQTIGNYSNVAVGAALTKLNLSFSDQSEVSGSADFEINHVLSAESKKSPIPDTEEAYIYANTTLEVPNGTSIADFPAIDLGIDWGSRLKATGNSRFRNACFSGVLKINGTFDAHIRDTSQFHEKFRGAASKPKVPSNVTARILFSNGESGSTQRKIEVILSGMKPSTYGVSGFDAEDQTVEKMGFSASRIKVVALSPEASAK